MFQAVDLSVAMVGLPSEPGAAGSRALIERIGAMGRIGVRGVQIDATRSGLRAREMDRSARRDLAALMRRLQIACSGLDVFVPSEHFLDAQTQDRAVASVVGAIELAAELRGLGAVGAAGVGAAELSVSVLLPRELPMDVAGMIESAADREGVRVADHCLPLRETKAGEQSRASEVIGVGIDPAALLSAGESPAKAAARLGGRVVLARVSDVLRGVAGVRCVPGASAGSLEVEAYRATLGVIGYRGLAVLDLRGVSGGLENVEEAVKRWRGE